MGPAHIDDSFWIGLSIYLALMTFMQFGGLRSLGNKRKDR